MVERESNKDVGKYRMKILHRRADECELSLKRELKRVNSNYWQYVQVNRVDIAHNEDETSSIKTVGK